MDLIFILAQVASPAYKLPPLPRGFGPAGQGLSSGIIETLLTQLANFLIGAGVIIAIITIVWSGLMYFKAGSDTEAAKAKGWFKNGLIGAFIILGVGVIIWTVYGLVTGQFFRISPFPGP